VSAFRALFALRGGPTGAADLKASLMIVAPLRTAWAPVFVAISVARSISFRFKLFEADEGAARGYPRHYPALNVSRSPERRPTSSMATMT